jgi:diguanylate cyclase (GGDEF)-like protein
LVEDDQIDMLITDIQMPHLDGYGLICRVRADGNPRIRDLPIVTITGAEDDETRIRAFACGSTDFLIKPFDQKLLHSRVHAYLRLKQASLLHAAAASGGGGSFDPLTGLHDLGAFLELGKSLYQQARRDGRDLSVTALDVDEFPTHRRDRGDLVANALLQHVAESLKSGVRREDVLARVGEAEFAILLPHANRSQAMTQCERLRARIADNPPMNQAGPVKVTGSFGLVTLSTDAPETFEKFLVLVEQRLSQARSDGGNRIGVTVLSDVMPEPEEVVLTGVSDPHALEVNAAGEIELSSDAGDLSVSDLEALVREEDQRRQAAKTRNA